MKKIHVSAINRKVRVDEKLFVEECDRKYNEKLVAIADSIEISDKAENAKRNTRRMGKMEREAAIERLTREMKEAAKLPPAPGREPHRGFGGRDGAQTEPCTDTTKREKIPWQTIRSLSKVPASTT